MTANGRSTALIRQKTTGWYIDPITKQKLRSVTTILNQGVPKEPLIFWAGNTVARSAIDNLPRLVAESRDPKQREQLYDWLKRAHTRKKDERADIGTAVHRVIEAHILGTPMPEELLDDPDMAPYLDHFQRFVRDFDVAFEASEMVVANAEHGWAGTLDYIVRSERIVAAINASDLVAGGAVAPLPAGTAVMGDTKTGGELDVKGVYPESALQMAAYKHGTAGWLRDGTKVAMPATGDVGVVLHLRPEGYRLIPVHCGRPVYEVFRHAYQIGEWTRDLSKQVVGGALAVPASPVPSTRTEVA